MRFLRGAALSIFTAASLGAQSVTVTPFAGVTVPLGGRVVQRVPAPPIAPQDSSSLVNEFTSGPSFGALVEVDFTRPFGLAAQVNVNLADRKSTRELDGVPPASRRVESRIVGAALLATTRVPVGERMQVRLGLGPELLRLSGGAASNEGDVLPPYYQVENRNVIGGLANVGATYRTRLAVLRTNVAYRYFAPRHVTGPDGFGVEASIPEERPYQQLLVTLGVEFQPWKRSR